MSKLKFTIILVVLISILFVIPSGFAQDNQTSMELASNESDVIISDYYFDANLDNDTGDGSQSNPYKNLNSDRILNNSIIHLANGVYDFGQSTVINNVTVIGQTTNKTIIQSANFRVNTSFTLINVTFFSTVYNNGNMSASNSVIVHLYNYGNVTCYSSEIDDIYNDGFMTTNGSKLSSIRNNVDFLSCNDVFYKAYLYNYGNLDLSYGLFTSSSINNNGRLNLSAVVLNKSKIVNNLNLFAIDSIFSNSSSTQGGAINSTGNIELKNCSFENNYATYGGAIYLRGEVVINISDSTFDNNYAKLYGGAIAIEGGSNATIRNSQFVNDYSQGDAGGAIYAKKSPELNILFSQFENCTATFGAAVTSLNSGLNLTSVSAKSNKAKYDGGVVYFMYGICTIIDSHFYKNSANNGGALYVDEAEIFNIFANNFTNNQANCTGGAIYSIYSDTFHDSVLSSQLNNSFSTNVASFESDVYEANSLNLEIGDGNYILIRYNPLYNGPLPEKFDLRNYGYVTPVKDQGSGGNCWSFSSTAALESAILKATNTSYDLSEENMKNLMSLYSDYGWAMDTNSGGYDDMGLGYLVSWLGPINESEDVYNHASTLSPILHSFIHVQNVIFLNRVNFTDNEAIKKAIMDYGAVSTSIYWTSSSLIVKNYYYSGNLSANHAVTIVGWDDNYSKNNFKSTPPGDGAWIVKNSWGTRGGENGFYYVSYYDTRLAPLNKSKAIYAIVLNDTIKLDKNYQYDISGKSDYLYNSTSTVWYKNRFISTDDEYLAAVSTYFQTETSWEVSIYVNDVLKHTQKGTATSSYKTINLDKLIPLKVGDVFDVVFKIDVKGDAGVPISEAVSFNKKLYRENLSFISYDGINWKDLYDLSGTYPGHTYTSQIACIKAFTILDRINTTIKLDVENIYNPAEISARVTDQYGNALTLGVVVFTIEGKNISVDVRNGIAKIVYNFKNLKNVAVNAMFVADGYNSAKSAISVERIISTTLKASNIVSYYGDVVEYIATLTDDEGKGIANKEVLFIINGENHIVTTNSKGQAILDLELDIGNYTIISRLNDKSLNSKSLSNQITIKSTIIMPSQVKYAYNSKYAVTLYDSEGNLLKNKDVSLLIDGVEYALRTDSNGKLSYTIKLNPGTYEMAVFNLNNFEIKYQTINVVKRITGNSALTMYYGAGKYYKIRVCGDDGKYVKGMKVTFTINKKSYVKYTDANGYVSLKIGLNPGTYTIKATYNGYSVSNKVTVKPTLVMSAKTVKKSKTFKYYVKLLNSNGKILKSKKITVKFKGKTYKAKTNSKGIATFKIKSYTKLGKFTLTASYGSAKISKKITVKK